MAVELNAHNRQDPDPEEGNGANHVESQANGVGSDGSDDGFSDASSDVTELGSGDFEAYFRERDERLFHSHGGLPYPLPVDTPEQERLNVLHRILYNVLGANFVGPVSQILTPVPEQRTRALDICTGTGTWVMEMASQFPHVKFNGFDIVPIATRRPHSNAQFEIHNVDEPMRWADNIMDLVHARATDMAVSNYPAMLAEAARVLRPGGLFLSGEWERVPSFANPVSGDADPIPETRRLLNLVDTSLARHGAFPLATCIPGWLAESGQFQDITAQFHVVPIGDWHPDPVMKELGNDFRSVWVRYADSLKPMLGEPGLGMNEAQIDDLMEGYLQDMHNTSGMVGVYHTVHAKKI